MSTQQWMESVSDGATVNAVASKAGVSQSTLATQLASTTGLKPDMAVRIARAYGSDPVVALVQVGLLQADEVTGVSADELRTQIAAEMDAQRLEEMTDDELMAEVRRLLAEVDGRLADPKHRREGRGLRED